MGVAMAGPFVKIDQRCATSMKNVWAVGDLTGEPMLAHKGSAQGEVVAEIIAGHDRIFDPVTIAAVCFTEPEIVSAGLGPNEVAGRDDVIQSVFPFAAIGRALAIEAGEDGGFVRVIASKADHRNLGIQAVGQHVSELSNSFAQMMEMGRCWKTWPEPSMSTRPWARPSTRPACAPSGTPSTSDQIRSSRFAWFATMRSARPSGRKRARPAMTLFITPGVMLGRLASQAS